MDRNIKTKVNEIVQEYLVERKAMFIPMACVATFMLVGYAAIDKEKPEITTNRIKLPYGEALDMSTIEMKDDHKNRDLINLEVVDSTLDSKQVGSYKVKVKATDQFSNVATKDITVDVVDKTAPEFEVLGSNEGYVVQVPVYGSNDIASYIKAKDNVDGDVTPFIEADKPLDTSKLGFQDITLSVSDSSGNKKKETFQFAVSDMEPPKIELLKGTEPVIDYGSVFSIDTIAKITDNYDTNLDVKVQGTVDTSKEEVQPIKIIAKDESGNVSEENINVHIQDISAPEIKLNRDQLTVTTGQAVNGKDYLISAIDNKDGNVTDKVDVSAVDTSTAGTKAIVYTVSDAAGNVAQAQLAVNVNAPAVVTQTTTVGTSPTANSAVGFAVSRIGSAYVYGAEGPNVFDCSGLTRWAFRQVGKSIPRSSGAQAAGGSFVPRGALQPGDLVFFSYTAGGEIKHVGMYVGGGMMVHAGDESTGVQYSSINILHYVTARRY